MSMSHEEYTRHVKVCEEKVYGHPCYGEKAHFSFGRVHLAVAPKCNIKCKYCQRKHDCANENRPGVASRVITPEEAVERVRWALEEEPRIRVAGIAGPGDPLANEATFETFARLKEEFPGLIRCLSTNGLLLPARIERLADVGVTTLTVTINALDPEIGRRIYSYVNYRDRVLRGTEAFELLSRNQLLGLEKAVEEGMVVKVNSVLIPGVNETHLEEVARAVRHLGAYTMNIMPLIPKAEFACITAPSVEELNRVRDACGSIMRQFRHCKQCRADAVGVPGEEGCLASLPDNLSAGGF
jgi:nitrogen fixation protein NifB